MILKGSPQGNDQNPPQVCSLTLSHIIGIDSRLSSLPGVFAQSIILYKVLPIIAKPVFFEKYFFYLENVSN